MTIAHELPGGHPNRLSRYLTETDAAGYFGVSTRTLRRWIAEGKVKAYRGPSGRLRFREDDLAAAMTPVPNGADR